MGFLPADALLWDAGPPSPSQPAALSPLHRLRGDSPGPASPLGSRSQNRHKTCLDATFAKQLLQRPEPGWAPGAVEKPGAALGPVYPLKSVQRERSKKSRSDL